MNLFLFFFLTVSQEKISFFYSTRLSLSNLALCSAGRQTQRGRKLQKTAGTASTRRNFEQEVRKIASSVTSKILTLPLSYKIQETI